MDRSTFRAVAPLTRASLALGLAASLVVTGAVAAQAEDDPGVRTSDWVNGDYAQPSSSRPQLTPDRLYYIDSNGDVRLAPVSAGPTLGQTSATLTSGADRVRVSAGRAWVADDATGDTTVFDGGQPGATFPPSVPGVNQLGLVSGTWFVLDRILRSLDGVSLDLRGFTHTGPDVFSSLAQQIVGSLFLVQTRYRAPACDASPCPGVTIGLEVRDAARAGELVGPVVSVPAPPSPYALEYDCLMTTAEVDCYFRDDLDYHLARVNYLTGAVSWTTLTAPAAVRDCQYPSVTQLGGGEPDRVGVVSYHVCQGLAVPDAPQIYAFNLADPSQYVHLDGDIVVAGSGNRLAIGLTEPDVGAYGIPTLRVVELPFGGTTPPHLIGVLDAGPASPGTPWRLDLDFTKPLLAGTLTIRNPAGAIVATIPTPATTDGSLRNLTWDPATTPAGQYTWTLQATDTQGQPAVSTIGDTPPSGTLTIQGCRVFTDVPVTHTFYKPICWAAATGVTQGSGNGSTYSPANPVNRGSMAQFLYRLAGSPPWSAPTTSPFTDVATTDTFYQAITWLYDQRITVGVTINAQLYYQPGNAVNRGSMAAFLKRLAGNPTWTPPAVSPFADVPTSHTFYPPITWLADTGITQGVLINADLSYAPGNPVNRGSMAAFMQRLARQHLHCPTYPTGKDCP
jgi:hypothetical protein